ncbi:MAG: thiosulfate oxidation carrier complex protein SoxZ [Gammaproteobacteria bacterium]|jgi:sulfur-oxidizing protein SoxZ|nr:thiosulfate oxidation carrier complex protein SoxZ [Gammaproteobacteria bacterium]
MASGIKIRTSSKDGLTTVRSIIKHPMNTGFEFDDDKGEVIPVYFIKEVICKHNDKVVLRCDWSRAVSKNPYLSFVFEGAIEGDTVSISWTDSKGLSESATITLK